MGGEQETEKERERGGFLITEGNFKYGGNTGTSAVRWEDGANGDASQQAPKSRRVQTFGRPE